MGVVRRLVSALRAPVQPAGCKKERSLGLELMEDRLVMDVTVGQVGNFVLPTGKDIFVPVPATDSDGLALQFSAQSNDEDVEVEVLKGGRSLLLNVSGADADGQLFSGSITIRLFEDFAPKTSAHLVSLVQQGFYNGLDFHRIIDDFMAQGGDGGAASKQYRIDDEFHPSLTFTSPGLLAMANAGDDTGTTQFFITDIDVPYANLPEHLNFDHTIVGQVTSGFATLNKILSTPTDTVDVNNTPDNPTDDLQNYPLTKVIINSATVITDNHNAVLRISGADDFLDTATITVTAANPNGQTDQVEFNVRGQTDEKNDRPFLGPISNLNTRPGVPVSFTVNATDIDGDELTISVSDPASAWGAEPDNVSVSIDQKTGKVTLTPKAGFVGTVDLKIMVQDSDFYDSQVIQLEVTDGVARPTNVDLAPESDTGLSNEDDFTSDDTPTILITARPGSTVEVLVNGVAAGVATETSAGNYTYTLPKGLLGIGKNDITARTVSGSERSMETAPLTITYQPDMTDVFTVPGMPGEGPVNLRFEYTSRQAMFANEFGFFIVDDASGAVDGIAPGQPGYAEAALRSSTRQTVFSQSSVEGQVEIVSLQPGQQLGFYLISNGSAEAFLESIGDDGSSGPAAFFGLAAANPDGIQHMAAITDAVFGQALYAWEDTFGGGDQDFNDMVVGIRLASLMPPVGEPTQAFTIPDSGTITQLARFQLMGLPGEAPLRGEFGFFYVDDAEGRIGDLYPANPGYAEVALDPARRQAIFTSSDSMIKRSVPVNGQTHIGFYFTPAGSNVTYFSFDIANPGSAEHFSWYNREQVSRPVPTAGDPLRLNVFGNGFDFTVALSFTA